MRVRLSKERQCRNNNFPALPIIYRQQRRFYQLCKAYQLRQINQLCLVTQSKNRKHTTSTWRAIPHLPSPDAFLFPLVFHNTLGKLISRYQRTETRSALKLVPRSAFPIDRDRFPINRDKF